MSDYNGIIPDLAFAQYTAAPGVNNSMLKILCDKTPAHLRAYLDGPPQEPTAAQRFGQLLHSFLLQPETMDGAYHVKPDGMKFNTKEGKAWQDEHAGKPILSSEEHAQIEAMVAAVHSHPSAKRLMANAAFEQSIFVTDSHGTKLKLRPDILPHAGDYLPDVKTCDSAKADEIGRAHV